MVYKPLPIQDDSPTQADTLFPPLFPRAIICEEEVHRFNILSITSF